VSETDFRLAGICGFGDSSRFEVQATWSRHQPVIEQIATATLIDFVCQSPHAHWLSTHPAVWPGCKQL